jgi:hypothetical protein
VKLDGIVHVLLDILLRCAVTARMPRDRYTACPCGMLVLSMAPLGQRLETTRRLQAAVERRAPSWRRLSHEAWRRGEDASPGRMESPVLTIGLVAFA